MNKLREALNGRLKNVVIGLLVLGVVLMAYEAFHVLAGQGSAAAYANERWFVCTETGKSFRHALSVGEAIPVASPYSGRPTGLPAELCYWTSDGHSKPDPTPVLLNQSVGKDGPTFCPDCGRLVVSHNPPAGEGARPPPTRAEYESAAQANQKHAVNEASTPVKRF